MSAIVSVLAHGGAFFVDVEGGGRRYQLPTRYRSRASATRAARVLARSMGATLDTREPWC